jgi:hypothetical protein
MAVFPAAANVPPASGFATFDTRNRHVVADFDAAVAESAVFPGFLSRNYTGKGITATIVWLATSATSGNVRWTAAFERHQDETTDLDADDFATAKGATGAAPSTSGAPQYTEIAFANGAEIDGLLAGESFRLKVTRDAANAADTMAGDAELLRVELRET